MGTAPSPLARPPADPGQPAWDIVRLFPNQGMWSEQDYLKLNGNYLVEYADGHVEVLPMPTDRHQAIVAFLFEALLLFARPRGLGTVRFAPLRVRLAPGKFREPDVLFLLSAHDGLRHNEFWDGADLVMEVVSDDDRRRDLETKRAEYALAGIPEYWIVDPHAHLVTVLKLAGDQYEVHGTFAEGQVATSALLAGFEVGVGETFRAGQGA